jgi:hypothetical protein
LLPGTDYAFALALNVLGVQSPAWPAFPPVQTSKSDARFIRIKDLKGHFMLASDAKGKGKARGKDDSEARKKGACGVDDDTRPMLQLASLTVFMLICGTASSLPVGWF